MVSADGASRIGWIIFLVITFVWLALFYDRGFNQFDEGNAIHPSIRVQNGDLPYRDFYTLYTGGVYYFYAALFKVFGVHIGIIRVALALLIGLTSVMTVRIAERLMPGLWPFLPGLVFLLAFPINPTAFHSWYSVFFGTAALLAMIRFLEDGRYRNLLIAGLAAGCGFLAKQTMGAFTYSGLIALLIWQFPLIPGQGRATWDRAIRTLCLLIAALVYTIYIQPAWMRQPHVAYLFLSLLWLSPLMIWFSESQDDANQDTSGVRPVLWITTGFLLPLVCYAGFFAWHGGLSDLIYGTFQFPGRYLDLWVNGNSFPQLQDWVQNPLGTFLLLLLAPAWAITKRWDHVFLRKILWPLLCLLLLIYPVRLILDGIDAWTSPSAFLGWANLEIFYSVVYLASPLIPWLVFPFLVCEHIRPGCLGLTDSDRRIIGAVFIAHLYVLFCIYPMQHPFYLVYAMPTAFVLYMFIVHRLWILSTEADWFTQSWSSRGRHTIRLASMLLLPLTAITAFVIWGSQYWLELRTLGEEGSLTLDKRISYTLPRGTWGIAVKKNYADPIEAICRHIRTRTSAEEPVFVAAANGPLIMFLSERDTPAPVHFPLGSLNQSEQTGIIDALDRTRTRYLVIDWRFEDAAVLWEYIHVYYTLDAEIDEYRIFQRNDAQP